MLDTKAMLHPRAINASAAFAPMLDPQPRKSIIGAEDIVDFKEVLCLYSKSRESDCKKGCFVTYDTAPRFAFSPKGFIYRQCLSP